MTINDTLRNLHLWSQEQLEDDHKILLLSKLATLELCGWIEGWMDQFVSEMASFGCCNPNWVDEHVIKKTSGFKYDGHLRQMLAKILGEHTLIVIERRFDAVFPGDIDRLKSNLSTLWKIRCDFAHNDISRNTQNNIYAPSWTQNQCTTIMPILSNFKDITIKCYRETPAN